MFVVMPKGVGFLDESLCELGRWPSGVGRSVSLRNVLLPVASLRAFSRRPLAAGGTAQVTPAART